MTLTETCAFFANLAQRRAQTATRAPAALFVASMLGGAFVGAALLLALTCTAGLPTGVRPLVSGAVYGIGLILVVLAGAEMFTGHVMFETFGIAKGAISWLDVLRLFAIVWTGNLAGSVLLTFLFAQAGGGVVFSSGTFLHDLVAKKEGAAFLPLLCKAILCNWLVCMAIWLGARLENEMAKMIGMAWCVAAFVACGFEHAVANMTAVSLGLFAPHPTGDLLAAAYNLSVVSLGNLIGGGGFVAAAYLWSSHGERAAAAPAPATVPQSAGAAVPGGLTPAMA